MINSYDLNYSHLKKFPSPFNTKNLPKKMASHSKLKHDEKLYFFDLIDKRISFDYLLEFIFVHSEQINGMKTYM